MRPSAVFDLYHGLRWIVDKCSVEAYPRPGMVCRALASLYLSR